MTNTFYLRRYHRQTRIDPQRLKKAVPIAVYASANSISVHGCQYWIHKNWCQGFKQGGKWFIYNDPPNLPF